MLPNRTENMTQDKTYDREKGRTEDKKENRAKDRTADKERRPDRCYYRRQDVYIAR